MVEKKSSNAANAPQQEVGTLTLVFDSQKGLNIKIDKPSLIREALLIQLMPKVLKAIQIAKRQSTAITQPITRTQQ